MTTPIRSSHNEKGRSPTPLQARTTGPWQPCLPALRCAAAVAAAAAGALLGLIHPQRTPAELLAVEILDRARGDRKSTRLNSSHSQISYAVFCLKKKMG